MNLKKIILPIAWLVILFLIFGGLHPINQSTNAELEDESSEIIHRWNKGVPTGIDVSPDKEIIAISTDTGLYFFDSITLKELDFGEDARKVTGLLDVDFAPDGKTIATANEEGIHLYELSENLKLVDFVLFLPNTPIDSIDFSLDKKSLVIRSSVVDTKLRFCERGVKYIVLYNLEEMEILYSQYFCGTESVSYRFTNDEKLFLFFGYNPPFLFEVIDSRTGNKILETNYYENNYQGDLIYDISIDGLTFVAVNYYEGKEPVSKLLDINSLEILETVEGRIHLSSHPNRRWVIKYHQELDLQDAKGKSICWFDPYSPPPVFSAPPSEVTWSSDGKIAITHSVISRKIQVWQVEESCQLINSLSLE